ncbi:hypothetical protein [Acinetobacter sp. 199]
MDTAKKTKAPHPWVQFLIGLLSVRAGAYIKQQPKESRRG